MERHREIQFAARSRSSANAPAHEPRLEIDFGEHSDRGRVRTENEDFLGHALPETAAEARSHGWLFALADGVGGHQRGELASRTAVESLLHGFARAPASELPSALVSRLVQEANAKVLETAHAAGPAAAGMATTIVACLLRYDQAAVAHVGDSRCYLVRRGRASRLTRDHTVAGEHVRLGLVSPDEVSALATRHLLSRSLGTELFVGVESSEHALEAGDVLALCSDGLHASLADDDFARAVAEHRDLTAGAQALVRLADQRDGSDNISVQLIRIRGVERVAMYRGRPYRLR
jgi:PPM family protein phosphatase